MTENQVNKQAYFLGQDVDVRRPGCPTTYYYVGSNGDIYSFRHGRYYAQWFEVPFKFKHAYARIKEHNDLPVQLMIGLEPQY